MGNGSETKVPAMYLEGDSSCEKHAPVSEVPTNHVAVSEVSNDKNPGCLVFLSGVILPSYIGIIISHYKDPY